MSNMRHCPHCNCSTEVIKSGVTSIGRQRYKCKVCNRTWSSKPRPHRLYASTWHDFALGDLTVPQLAQRYQLCDKTIRKILGNYKVPPIVPHGRHDVIAADVTYFGRDYGLLVVIDANTGEGLYVAQTRGYETSYDYRMAIEHLAGLGIYPKACIVDGKRGVIAMLEEYGILAQYCQFHQIKTINSYLTRKPVLLPNIELRHIALSLTHVKPQSFINSFWSWRRQYAFWLKEQIRNPETGKLEYSHQKTRAAARSILTNMKYLFTYYEHPELHIPNTNNRLEGLNRALKYKLRRHSGASKELKTKIAVSFISGRTEE